MQVRTSLYAVGVALALGSVGCGAQSSPSGPSSAPTPAPTVRSVVIDLIQAHSGCPTEVRFGGVITASGTGRVTYRWEISDGNQSGTFSLDFGPDAAPPPGVTVWITKRTELFYSRPAGSGTVSGRLHMLTPYDWITEANYVVVCPS